jgi:hypothetical protein
MVLALRCALGSAIGLATAVGFLWSRQPGRPLWPWWAALFVGAAMVTWKQPHFRWLVALAVWSAHFVWVDWSWRSERSAMLAKDPYCCVVAGLEGLVAMTAIFWPVLGSYFVPIARQIPGLRHRP